MTGNFLPLNGGEEGDLDADSRKILEGLRELLSECEAARRPAQAIAAPEERHLRLRLARGANDWVDLLVGDGYTEFTRSGERGYRGYLRPQETSLASAPGSS